VSSPGSDISTHPVRHRSSLWKWLLVTVLLIAAVVLIIPQETGKGGKYGREFPDEDIHKRNIGLELAQFQSDDGSNPDDQTRTEVFQLNPESKIQLGTSSSNDSFHQLFASGIESAWSAVRRHGTKFKSWSDDRGLSGVICSVATGEIPERREIIVVGGLLKKSEKSHGNLVCCYDADTGKILWEHQDGEFFDWKHLQVWVSLDMQGDVFIASCTPNLTTTSKLEKRSGLDGHLMWRMDFTKQKGLFSSGGWQFRDYIFPPSVDRTGNVWLLRTENPGKSGVIHLSLLNGRNGELISSSLVAEKVPYSIRPKDFVCLEGGGAILFHSYGHARYVTRYSADGKQISQFPVTRTSDNYQPEDFRLFVDERHQRIILCDEVKTDVGWPDSPRWGSREVGVVAFSITSGTKLWDTSIDLEGGWGYARGYIPELVRLLPKGDLEFRHEEPVTRKRINWRKWTEYKGIPVPERIIEKKTRLLRTIMSGEDGSVGKADVVKSAGSWFQVQLEESGSSTKEIFDLRFRLYLEGENRCRDSRSWRPAEEDGPGSQKTHCFRVLRCPSGRAVLSRDPQAFYYGHRENLWQVSSP
jgi:hypothetical protein